VNDETLTAQAAAWFAEYDKRNHFPEMLALDAYAAGHAAAQQQGQAVDVELTRDAERYRWLRRNVSAHGVIDGWTFAFPTHLALPAPASAMRDPAGGLDAAIDQARGTASEAAP
jgi:hypothetical protein